MLDLNTFNSLIKKYDKIAIFRHIRPDYDAIGSQVGLARYIRNKYPNKEVLVAGDEPSMDPDFLESPVKISNEWIKDALAIVVDTSSLKRIDGHELFLQADEHMLFDHHHETEPPINNNNLVDTTASSCGEILGLFLRDVNNGIELDLDVAEALYAAIISDSLKFSISQTTSRTLEVASYLIRSGIDVNKINVQTFSLDMNNYLFANHLRSIANYDTKGFTWCMIEKEDYEKFGITSEEAKSKVSLFAEIKGNKYWVAFAKEDHGEYSASLRSHNLLVRDVAEKYGGGGHDCASGIPKISYHQCLEIIEIFKQRVSTS